MRSRAHEVLPPSKLRERRKRARTVRISILLFFLLLLLCGIVGFFYIKTFLIRDVVVVGTTDPLSSAIQETVKDTISGTRVLVLPARNAFIYSHAQVVDALHEAYPQLKDINVALGNLHTIEVTVAERSPYGVWCDASDETLCRFMDVEGVIFAEAPEFSGDAYVRWYGGDGALGHRYLSSDTFRPLSTLVAAFESEGFMPRSVRVDDVDDVHVETKSGTDLIFTLAQKPEEVLKSLRSAKNADALRDIDQTAIAYIDLRFGNRLYYKLR